MSGIVGRTKGEPSRVGYMGWTGGGGEGYDETRAGGDHVIG